MARKRSYESGAKVPISLSLVEGENNWHLKIDTPKDIEFLSPPVFMNGYTKPNAFTIKHPAIQPIFEGTWAFDYKSEKSSKQKQTVVTPNIISFDKWNELVN